VVRERKAYFHAASQSRDIMVAIDSHGIAAGVRLSGGVMKLSDDELASRIIRLNALASLRRLHALAGSCGNATSDVRFPTDAQVAAYAATIDF
jgi:hypothetical protein